MHAAAAAAAGVVAPSAAWVSRQRRLAARDGATQVRVEWHAASRGVTSISITTWHDNDKTFKRKTAGCQQEGAGRRRASQPLRAAQEEGPRAASDASRAFAAVFRGVTGALDAEEELSELDDADFARDAREDLRDLPLERRCRSSSLTSDSNLRRAFGTSKCADRPARAPLAAPEGSAGLRLAASAARETDSKR